MGDGLNIDFIKQRIPQSCCNLIDLFATDKRHSQLAAADRWLLEATTSHFGQNRFVWGELLMDLAHYYPHVEDDSLKM